MDKMKAETTLKRISEVFQARNLDFPVQRARLLYRKEIPILWITLNVAKIKSIRHYANQDLLDHISAAIKLDIIPSFKNGISYLVKLSNQSVAILPQLIDFPGWRANMVQLGTSSEILETGLVFESWESIGHVLVGGMTGSGKSNFLQLLAYQAMQDGHALVICDPKRTTFGHLVDHPQLLHPVGLDVKTCQAAVEYINAEISERMILFSKHDNPENLAEYNQRAKPANFLKRVILIVDEINGLIQLAGGTNSEMAKLLQVIAWQSRQFGINFVMAGQTMKKELVGDMREQFTTRICFKVDRGSTSNVILGNAGAENIDVPGRALTNNHGLIQTFFLQADLMNRYLAGDGLTENERHIARQLIRDHDGKMTYAALSELGVGRRTADSMRADWISRGLAIQDKNENNAFVLSAHLVESLQSGQPAQALTNHAIPS